MRKALLMAAITAVLSHSSQVIADSETDAVKQQLEALKKNYQQRIEALESRLSKTEKSAEQANTQVQNVEEKLEQSNSAQRAASNQNAFNPAISLVLDGRYASFDNKPEDYALPGFALGGEAELGDKGLSLGHSELILSANIDDNFYGQMTIALAEHDGETRVELEEAFIQTLGLGNGFTIKAGRFFSEIGYLNGQHSHVWDFADAPLIYRGLFGNQLIDDGMQLTYVAPIDLFLQVGGELLSGSRFPASGRSNGIGAWTAFLDVGGDMGVEHSWQIGLSHWQADDIEGRESGGHAHGGGATDIPSFTGESEINAIDVVYKWAPDGNPTNQNFTLQFEYFDRKEDGVVTLLNSAPLEATRYDGHQKGGYVQATYQFQRRWKTGVRYDQLDSNNSGPDAGVLAEAGLDNAGHTPRRYSAMLEWLPGEFSRVRLQYNQDQSYQQTDNQIFLQYTMSLGSHNAHQF